MGDILRKKYVQVTIDEERIMDERESMGTEDCQIFDLDIHRIAGDENFVGVRTTLNVFRGEWSMYLPMQRKSAPPR